MELIELRGWELTAARQERFEQWLKALIHHEFLDLRNREVYFTPLAKPLAQSTVALVSTGGLRLKSQQPYDLLDPNGDWSIRPIPSDTPVSDITINHSHYNHGDADDDVNCIFPIERVREMADAGFIGGVTRTFIGMMGFVPNATHIVEEAGPEVARRLKAEGAEVVLLTGG